MSLGKERYWLRHGKGPWREATQRQFVDAESEAGFYPKPGCGPLATAGFSTSSGGDSEGLITYGDPRKGHEQDKDFIAAVELADGKTEGTKVTFAQILPQQAKCLEEHHCFVTWLTRDHDLPVGQPVQIGLDDPKETIVVARQEGENGLDLYVLADRAQVTVLPKKA